LVDLHQAVDIRHIATLVDQAKTALYFHKVIGYDMPVVSGLIRTRERAIMSMGCTSYGEIEEKLQRGIDRPVPPKYVETAPHKQVIQTGDEVDLFRLPVPMSSIYDGGPMITAFTVNSAGESVAAIYGLNVLAGVGVDTVAGVAMRRILAFATIAIACENLEQGRQG
jgi:UbiD family decarboxylase